MAVWKRQADTQSNAGSSPARSTHGIGLAFALPMLYVGHKASVLQEIGSPTVVRHRKELDTLARGLSSQSSGDRTRERSTNDGIPPPVGREMGPGRRCE